MAGMFHLGWFLNFVADEWNGNWGDGGRDFTGDFYVEMAKDLERAKFDYVLIEDKLMVSTAFGGTMEHDLKHGVNPKHDPVPLAVLMGIVPNLLLRPIEPAVNRIIDQVHRGAPVEIRAGVGATSAPAPSLSSGLRAQ